MPALLCRIWRVAGTSLCVAHMRVTQARSRCAGQRCAGTVGRPGGFAPGSWI